MASNSTTDMPAASATAVHPKPTHDPNRLCLDLSHVFLALVLVVIILTTVVGNVLVVLSVLLYKRMRTFTNMLLTSLATADLLLGIFVSPVALISLLKDKWAFDDGRVICYIWTTVDILLCTASILNLCVISLDRYMAITSPLRYSRTRSRKMAVGLLTSVWLIALIICSPPWIIPQWRVVTERTIENVTVFICDYPRATTYRIYSACGSFYIPFVIMMFVYARIFKVANERELLMQKAGRAAVRLSQRNPAKQRAAAPQLSVSIGDDEDGSRRRKRSRLRPPPQFRLRNLNNSSRMKKFKKRGSSDRTGETEPMSTLRPDDLSSLPPTSPRYFDQPPPTMPGGSVLQLQANKKISGPVQMMLTSDESSVENNSMTAVSNNGRTRQLIENDRLTTAVERDCQSMAELHKCTVVTPDSTQKRSIGDEPSRILPHQVGQRQAGGRKTQTSALLATAGEYYANRKPGRGSREKMVYMRERKALKTIGIVVLGFLICWLPFFIFYLLDLLESVHSSAVAQKLGVVFLWFGYSNSVLNPIIYTMYNGDFRRCFRDLLAFGCWRRHRRSMSVRRLQQSTMF